MTAALRDTLARLKATHADVESDRVSLGADTIDGLDTVYVDALHNAFPALAAALDRAQRVEEALDECAAVLRGDELSKSALISALTKARIALAAPDEKEIK